MKKNDFVNLHIHSEYSLLDGACRIKKLVKHIKALGQTAAAVTDHGNMYGAIEFYIEALKEGIKPIIGCEVYVAKRSRFDKEPKLDSSSYHLILLCENNLGYKNLVKLVSLANIEGFYNKPRVDIELLRKYSGGLICLSACLAGEISRHLVEGNYEDALNTALLYQDIFGKENYFLEIQNHGLAGDARVLPLLYKLSEETGIPLVATNDCHYISKSDAKMQNILLCIQMNKTIDEQNDISFENDEFYVKSTDEMENLFKSKPDALLNTVKIAERCNVNFEFGKIKLPKFEINGVKDNNLYFKELCYKGMHKIYGENPSDIIKNRLEYELDVIMRMGYTDYFLIVWDFILYAKKNDIPVGPGRGSGAGSLCAYCIGITGIDPIKYNLLFERFLNPERVSMPDFDIDFCIEGRQQVKDYVISRYGAEYVSEIIAFDTLKARAALRDVGRVMKIPYQLCDKVAKLIEFGSTLDEALNDSNDLRYLYKSEKSVHDLIDMSKELEGMPRHASTHAAGVVISAVPISDLVPLQKNDDTIVTQYTMNILDSLGLLKMDFLGLRNLTVIHECVKKIQKNNPDFDINSIPIDDANVYKMLSKGDTTGVFQFESSGMRQKLIDLQPEKIEDLIAVLSLYRPGPMKSIPIYIENKRNPQNIKYKHKLLKSILSETYGCIVYQEQVMEIFRKLAGYSYGRADIVRRAMAKKKQDVMLKEREGFVNGAVSNGVSEEIANDIFDEMISFASYAFNKSHAAAYSYLAYQTAYLKCHFFNEYMSSLMSSVMSNTSKLLEYISECKAKGTNIVNPDVNKSNIGFTFADGKIYFGLLAIKNCGRGLIEKIIAQRANGNYTDIIDFLTRADSRELNKRVFENLVKSGALDSLGLNRHQLLDNSEELLSSTSDINDRNNIEGQLNFLNTEEERVYHKKIPYIEEMPKSMLLNMEKEATGMYLSGDPLEEFAYLKKLMHCDLIGNVCDIENKLDDGKKVVLLCTIQSLKQHTTKKGSKMAFISIEDGTGEVEALIFPEIFAVSSSKLREDAILLIKGTLSYKDEKVTVICNSIFSSEEFAVIVEKMRLCVKINPANNIYVSSILSLFKRNEGKTEICFFMEDTKKFISPKERISVKITQDFCDKLKMIIPEEKIGLI